MSVEQSEQDVPTDIPTFAESGGSVAHAGDEPAPDYNDSTVPPPAPEEPDGEVRADPARDESERLDPQPVQLKLESGLEFDLQPLKLRQFLRLLRIITRGATDVLDSANLSFDDPDSFAQTFAGLVMFSIPEAEEEAVEFVKSIVKPSAGVLTGDLEKDRPHWDALMLELDNPELDDFVTIVQALIEREAEDLRALGKRLMKMFETARLMGATGKNANVNPA